MKILIVSRYKTKYVDHQAPFVTEQGLALRKAGCEIEFFLLKGNYLKAAKELRNKIRETKPDIVHAHYGVTAIVVEIVSSVPAVVTFHNGETHHWYVNFISSLFSLMAKHVIYVAQHIHNILFFKAKHYSILPCGISLEDCVITPKEEARKKLGWDPAKKYILFGGGFIDLRKNAPLLKSAVALLNRPDIEVVELWNLNREQCFLYMSACDLFALPTKNEGSPQSLKEAMAIGCPIVATDVADIKHLLGDLQGHYILKNKKGNEAYWVGDDDSIVELSNIITEALQLPSDFKTQGRERIVELGYTNPLVAQTLIQIYNEVLSR